MSATTSVAGAGATDHGRRRAARIAIVCGAALPVLALAVLRAYGVPLGQPGKFSYLYSEFAGLRMRALPAALLLAGLAVSGVWLLAAHRWRSVGGLLVMGSAGGLAAWVYFSPPAHAAQHVFNLQSPSQDGAFLNEARRIRELRDYLVNFPTRARTPPAEMRGTRVISNPPGATLLALAARWLLWESPSLRELATSGLGESGFDSEFEDAARHALVFAWLMLALWVGAVPILYLAGREFLSADSAAALALCTFASAATFLFSPGKDPAQLMATALVLWLALRAVRRDSIGAAILAGAALVLAGLMSLVHVWVALILGIAAAGSAARDATGLRRRVLRQILPAAGAAALVAGVLRVTAGIDLLAIARATATSQAQVTRLASDAMPFAWQLLGAPLFLLFCGPAVWFAIVALTRPAARPNSAVPTVNDAGAHDRFATWLGLTTLLVMIGTIGFTNAETPRLWLPFVPLLLLGAAARSRPIADGPDARRMLLALLVGVQIVAGAAQWALMDMRESEMRLVRPAPGAEPRLFN